MAGSTKHLDVASQAVVAITLVLFVVALFIKGFGHDILLEAGVFLVSVKLILMSSRNAVAATDLSQRLARIESALDRIANRMDDPRTG